MALKLMSLVFGTILWEMLFKKIPYAELSHPQIFEHVVTRGWRLPISNSTPEGLKKLITRCWAKNQTDRPTFPEILEMFKNGDIYFPESEKIDFSSLFTSLPPLDLEYVEKVLSNPTHSRFSSVTEFLSNHLNPSLRKWLQEKKFIQRWSLCLDESMLVLCGGILQENEFESFLDKYGFHILNQLINSGKESSISAAVKFCLLVPQNILEKTQKFVPNFVSFPVSDITKFILQFLARFKQEVLQPYLEKISNLILSYSTNITDQISFDAVAKLIPYCLTYFDNSNLFTLYHLIGSEFVIPCSVVEIFLSAKNIQNKSFLIYRIFTALEKSKLESIFLRFLDTTFQSDPSIFFELINDYNIFSTLQSLIENKRALGPLFFVFCVSTDPEIAVMLSKHSLFRSIVALKDYKNSRLQLYTSFCCHKDFCENTTEIEGIIHLLVTCLPDPKFQRNSTRLFAALSSHQVGCTILEENGLLELFIQLFLSSSKYDTILSLLILRNFSNFGLEIPQHSLLVSCLMQDLLISSSNKIDIIHTLYVLVSALNSSVQEFDVNRILLKHLKSTSPPIVYWSLKVLTVCTTSIIVNLQQSILINIHSILSNFNFCYPEIIEASLEILTQLSFEVDLDTFTQHTGLMNYLEGIKNLIPSDHYLVEKIEAFTSIVSGSKNSILISFQQ